MVELAGYVLAEAWLVLVYLACRHPGRYRPGHKTHPGPARW